MTEQQSQTPPPLKVILASKSPRRRDLLKEAGIKFTVRTPIEPVDETLDADDLMMPVEAVKKLAERKAGALIQELIAENPQVLFMVLGADTMVVKGGDIFGKPRNLDDAKRMLGEQLMEKTSPLHTGLLPTRVSSHSRNLRKRESSTICEKVNRLTRPVRMLSKARAGRLWRAMTVRSIP